MTKAVPTPKGVRCPICGGSTRVTNTLQLASGQTHRRRMCKDCGKRFCTVERPRASK